jgi:hypothetical protein
MTSYCALYLVSYLINSQALSMWISVTSSH